MREVTTLATRFGPMHIVATDGYLERVCFDHQRHLPTSLNLSGEPGPTSEMAAQQITEYLHGERREFDLDYRPTGTDFQQLVWGALVEVPYGQTVTYAQLATNIGRPRAVRAVAMANARNPLSLVVPCHRVIGTNGSLTGYAGGTDVKAALLHLEGSLQMAALKN